MKQTFIENEIWILTFGGAFQRAEIYKKEATEKQKAEFRNKIKDQIRTLVVRDYSDKPCSSEQHVNNMLDFSNWTNDNFGSLLNGGRLNFGVTQKLINLYLKYSWCLGRIAHTPTSLSLR